jgi:hypothetical protein
MIQSVLYCAPRQTSLCVISTPPTYLTARRYKVTSQTCHTTANPIEFTAERGWQYRQVPRGYTGTIHSTVQFLDDLPTKADECHLPVGSLCLDSMPRKANEHHQPGSIHSDFLTLSLLFCNHYLCITKFVSRSANIHTKINVINTSEINWRWWWCRQFTTCLLSIKRGPWSTR